MKTLILVLTLLMLALGAPVYAKSLVISIDVSESNPVITSEPFARAVAQHAYREVAALQLGDTLSVRHIGERSADKVRSETLRVTRRNPPAALSEKMRRYIAALPGKTTQPDHLTNILAFFQLVSFDCAHQQRIVVYTDGIEASSTMSERAFLSGKPLPRPPKDFLKGCEVVMFGLGQSKDGHLPLRVAESIRARWSDYFKVAGANFTAIMEP